ncbi:MAG TPA: hypothetical protein VNX68_12775 [Nitrosopumilaceae archaeon]|nr:hypothetical protein [Nitrosopumilaceae archaeon]
MAGGIMSATKAALAFCATPLGLILGAIAIAISSVKAAFESSEAGQNKFAKIMSVIGSVVQTVIDVFAKVGDVIIDVFEHPMDSIKKFVTMIKENIINRFTGLLELLPALGEAISDVFHGKFKEAGKVATNALAKVALGVDHIVEKTDNLIKKGEEWIKQQEVNAKRAAKVADMKAKNEKEEREFSGKKLELESKIADLREKMADKESYSAEERKKFAKEAIGLDEELFGEEKKLADQRKEAVHLELDWRKASGKLNKEQLKQLQEVDDKSTEVDIAKARSGKTLMKAEQATQREINALAKAAAAARKAEIKEHEKLIKDLNKKELKGEQEVTKGTLTEIEKKKQTVQDSYESELASLDELKDNKKISDEEYTKYTTALELKRVGEISIIDKDAADVKAKEDKKKATKDAVDALERTKADLASEADTKILEAGKNSIKILEIRAKLLSDSYDLTIKQAILEGKTTSDIEKNFNKEKLKNAQELSKAKSDLVKKNTEEEFKLASDLQGSLADLNAIAFQIKSGNLEKGSAAAEAAAHREFEINKALQLSSAVITGIKSVMNAYTNGMENPVPLLGPATAAIYAGIAAIASAANVGKISSTQFKTTSGSANKGNSGTPNIPRSNTSMLPPSLTAIGGKNTNMSTNMGNNSGSSNNKQGAIKAIVVSTDLTKQQNSDAAIQRRATIR